MSKPDHEPEDPAADARRRLHGAIGDRIRDVRTRLGVGQAECARGAGIDTSSMFRIEKGSQNVTAETLARLAVSLGVTIDELLLGVEADPDLVVPRTRG
jgi:transcriptional regulator with XRE-family HTH domain